MTPRLSLEEQNRLSSLHQNFSRSDSLGCNSCSPVLQDVRCPRSQSHLSCLSSNNTLRGYSGRSSSSHNNNNNNRIPVEGLKENARYTSFSLHDERKEVRRDSLWSVRKEGGERNSFSSNDTSSSIVAPSSRKRSYIDHLEDSESAAHGAEERDQAVERAVLALSSGEHYTPKRETEVLSSHDAPHRSSASCIPLSVAGGHVHAVPRDPFLDDPVPSRQGEGGCTSGSNAIHYVPQGNERDVEKKKPPPTTMASKSISRSRSVSWVDLAEGKNLEVMVSSSGIPSSRRRRCPSEYASRNDTQIEPSFTTTPFSHSVLHLKGSDFYFPGDEEVVVQDLEASDAFGYPPAPSSVPKWGDQAEEEEEEEEDDNTERTKRKEDGSSTERRKLTEKGSPGDSFMESVRQGARKVPRLEEVAVGTGRSTSAPGEVVLSGGMKEVENLWEKNFWSRNETVNGWERPQKHARTPFHSYPFSSHPSLERKREVEESRTSVPIRSLSFSALQIPERMVPSSVSVAPSWDSSSRSDSAPLFHPEACRSTQKACPPSLSSSLNIGRPMFQGLSAIPLNEDLFEDRKVPIPQTSVSLPGVLLRTPGMHTSATAKNAYSSSEQRISSVTPSGQMTCFPTSVVPSTPSSSSSLLPREEVSVQHLTFSPCWCLIGSVRAGMPSSLRLEIISTAKVDSIGGTVTFSDRFSARREASTCFPLYPFALDSIVASNTIPYRTSCHPRGVDENENRAPPLVASVCHCTGQLRWICVTPQWREADTIGAGGGKKGADKAPTQHPVTIAIEKIQEVLLNSVVLEGFDDGTESGYAALRPSHVQVRAGVYSSRHQRIQERYTAVTIRMASGCRPEQVTFGFDARRKGEARRLRTLLLPLVTPRPR